MILVPIILIIVIIVGYLVYLKYSLDIKRGLLIRKSKHLYDQWEAILKQGFPAFEKLQSQDRTKLLEKMTIFYFEKIWYESLDESEKVLICARGAFSVLYRKTNFYPGIKEVRDDEGGDIWYRELRKQFEFEQGKLRDRNMKENFCTLVHDFLYNSSKIKNEHPQFFKRLERFFGNSFI